MDELYEKFLPQFIQLAHDRIERGLAAAARPGPAALLTVMRELHAIAGEAGLLGIAPVMQLARQAEDRAKRLRDDATQPNADALAAALRELRSALDLVGASSRPPGGEP